MRNKFLIYILFILQICLSRISFSQYSLDDFSYRGRYVDMTKKKFYSSNFTVDIYIHESMQTYFGVTKVDIEDMAAEWNNAGSFLQFSLHDGGTGWILTDDEINIIGADHYNPLQADFFKCSFNPNSGNCDKAAITVGYFWNNPGECDSWDDPAIKGADIVITSQRENPTDITTRYISILDNECGDNTKSRYDLKYILLHELGHVAGLHHHPSTSQDDIMKNSVDPGDCTHILSPKDKAAIQRLYGEDNNQNSSIPCSTFNQTPYDGLHVTPAQTSGGDGEGNPSGCEAMDYYMMINGNSNDDDSPMGFYVPGLTPCINLPIVLQPVAICANPGWKMNYTETTNELCFNVGNSNLCKTVLNIQCDCKYLEYTVKIWVDGAQHSKLFSEQRDANDNADFELVPSVTIDKNTLDEMGVFLVPGKTYIAELVFKYNIYFAWFKYSPQDISLANINLINTADYFQNLSSTLSSNDYPASELIGRNVSLNNITTTNNYNPNDINIKATKAIVITNSDINPGFSASIVNDECEDFTGKMANPEEKNKNKGHHYYENIYYNNVNSTKENGEKQGSKSSLENAADAKILIVPNPSSSGKFTVQVPAKENIPAEIMVYNLLGDLVYRQQLINSTAEIDISSYPQGIYYVQIQQGEEITVKKVVYN